MDTNDHAEPGYRSIVRLDENGNPLIMLAEGGVAPERRYEIRALDSTRVLAVVDGQQLLDLRQEQLTEYLQAAEGRTDIRMVDVSSLLPAGAKLSDGLA